MVLYLKFIILIKLLLCALYSQILPTVLSSASSAECLASKAIPCCARCCHIFCGSGVKVDEACRILFPLSFLLFNALYWWYYIYKT